MTDLPADAHDYELPDPDDIIFLTADSASQLVRKLEIEQTDSLFLPRLTALSADVAKELASFRGVLGLDGLATLTFEAAVKLVDHVGDLHLNGLSYISSTTANALARHAGAISLNGLSYLSPEIAFELSQCRDELRLNGLCEISAEAAEALSQAKCKIAINGLINISDKAARALANYSGEALYFDVEHFCSQGSQDYPFGYVISTETVNALENNDRISPPEWYRGANTHEITRLNYHQVEKLAHFWEGGVLDLTGISALQPNEAAALYENNHGIDLSGLTDISAEAAESLSNMEYVCLDGLTSISVDLANALAEFEGELSLNGVKELSAPAAAALAEFSGSQLSLCGIRSLTNPKLASVLIAHFEPEIEDLSFDSLQELSDDAANALADFQGDLLQLSALKFVSAQAIAALRRNENIEFPQR